MPSGRRQDHVATASRFAETGAASETAVNHTSAPKTECFMRIVRAPFRFAAGNQRIGPPGHLVDWKSTGKRPRPRNREVEAISEPGPKVGVTQVRVWLISTYEMISDLDIWRAANLLIRKHGADAELEAAKRADLMLDRGDDEGQLLWRRIKRAIGALQGPPSGKSY